jgi:hypothetical protein
MLYTVLIVLLVLAIIGGVPSFGLHSYGYGPSGGLTILLIIVLVLMFSRGGHL